MDSTPVDHDVLERRAELHRELPVRDQNKTDHEQDLAGAPQAPHGRATIKTIGYGSTRAVSKRSGNWCAAIARCDNAGKGDLTGLTVP